MLIQSQLSQIPHIFVQNLFLVVQSRILVVHIQVTNCCQDDVAILDDVLTVRIKTNKTTAVQKKNNNRKRKNKRRNCHYSREIHYYKNYC